MTAKRICVFGDSIVWGALDAERGGWVNRLRLEHEQGEGDTEVYNLGICGNTSTQVLSRIKGECEAREPSEIIVAVGINDSSYFDAPEKIMTPLDEFRENMRSIVEVAREFTEDVMLVGLVMPVDRLTAPMVFMQNLYYRRLIAEQYDAVVYEVAEQAGVKFVGVAHLLTPHDFIDGLHPNARGHAKLHAHISLKHFSFSE